MFNYVIMFNFIRQTIELLVHVGVKSKFKRSYSGKLLNKFFWPNLSTPPTKELPEQLKVLAFRAFEVKIFKNHSILKCVLHLNVNGDVSFWIKDQKLLKSYKTNYLGESACAKSVLNYMTQSANFAKAISCH